MAAPTPNHSELSISPEAAQRMRFKRGLRRKRKKERDDEEAAVSSELNIVPMMDMFTILLVFLLKSFGSDSANITMDQNLQLPSSSSLIKLDELVAVTVTSKQILVGDKKVVDLEIGTGVDGKPITQVPPSVRDNAGKGMLIVPVEEQLRKEIDKIKQIAEYNPAMKVKNQILVIGDENMPYNVLTMVLYTAGKVGLDGYKFVVIAKNAG